LRSAQQKTARSKFDLPTQSSVIPLDFLDDFKLSRLSKTAHFGGSETDIFEIGRSLKMGMWKMPPIVTTKRSAGS